MNAVDFVTVVSVGGSCGGGPENVRHHQRRQQQQQQQQQQRTQAQEPEDSFVTVLAIGDDAPAASAPDAAAEEVLVYRLPGERLGFGLRFDGVDASNRLYVQSCADGSPASRTRASWGPLSAGDEIVRIDGRPVNRLSRDDCVRCLKESGLVVKLHMVGGGRPASRTAPPPVPPRKQKKPEPPVAASAVYTDAVERFVYHGESESDDTNSSVSTVVSKGGKSNCGGGGALVFDGRALEPFVPPEREFPSGAAAGDDRGPYEKPAAAPGEDRVLPPKPLPRKEVRPVKKKQPPPPPADDPVAPADPTAPVDPVAPPPAYHRLPPRLVDFVHKDELLGAAEDADAVLAAIGRRNDDDDDDANDDPILCLDMSDDMIAVQDVVPEKNDDRLDGEERRQSSVAAKRPSAAEADLTASEHGGGISRPEDRCCGGGGGGGGEQAIVVMKSSLSESGGVKHETDSDVAAAAVGRRRRPSPDEVCNRSVRDKIAMFSRAAKRENNGHDNNSAVAAAAASSGTVDSVAAYCCSSLPRKPPSTGPGQQQQQQWRRPAAAEQRRPSDAADHHRRSQSLVEQPYSKYFTTMNAYAEMGRSSLNALIEQRRRSMSKLRGLVIPEKPPLAGDACRSAGRDDPRAFPAAIADLPLVIKSPPDTDDADDTDAAVLCPPTETYVNGPPPVTGTVTRYPNPVKTVTAAAARRQTYAGLAEHRRPASALSPPPPPPPQSSASSPPSSPPSTPSTSSSSSSSSLNSSREELRHIHDNRSPSTPPPPLPPPPPPSSLPPCSVVGSKGSFKTDSDEDSALSSSRSSSSLQQYSPVSSPPPPPPSVRPQPPPPTVRPTPPPPLSAEIGRRVLKAESVEAINRKNVLCSARISSGKPEPSPLSATLFGGGGHATVTQKTDFADALPPAKSARPVVTAAAFVVGTAAARYTHMRMSSVESTTSDDSSMQYAVNAEPFGSISSLASSTSLISQQELQQLIDDANQTLEESGGVTQVPAQPSSLSAVPPLSVEVMVIILHRDMATSSVGITLAGGADYETKEITVYKVLSGSPADKDGRIRKGDRILSINGKSMKGITHRESLAILKAPRSEVVLVISRCKQDATAESGGPPRSQDPVTSAKNETATNRVFGQLIKVTLSKDGSGLGFSLEGGKNSPTGDQPLTVKKIFTGGSADQCGQISAGDELVSVNDIDVTGMSRTEAWNLMKRLVNGTVTLGIRHVV